MSRRGERRATNRVGLHYIQGLRYQVIEVRREVPTKLHEPLRWHTMYQVQDRWTQELIGSPSENRERTEKAAKRYNRERRSWPPGNHPA